MIRTTTVKEYEYDEKGFVTKETVVVTEENISVGLTPYTDMTYPVPGSLVKVTLGD